jgi:ribosomal protein S18 acetylase RimI-like enzyme
MIAWDEKTDIVDLKSYVPLEKAYILYGNLFIRPERCLTLIDDGGEEGRVVAVGSYLKGMPFHAFTIHVQEKVEMYELEGMLARLRAELDMHSPVHSTLGVITVEEGFLQRLRIRHIQSQRTMLLMKLTSREQLLPPGDSRLITSNDVEAITPLTEAIGMISFRPDELLEMPHLGLFDGPEPVALAGFHIYQDEYVEIGNIGTSPAYRGKGLATRITSDITRVGMEISENVYLCVFEDNGPAIRVYEKLGFSTVARYVFVNFLF